MQVIFLWLFLLALSFSPLFGMDDDISLGGINEEYGTQMNERGPVSDCMGEENERPGTPPEVYHSFNMLCVYSKLSWAERRWLAEKLLVGECDMAGALRWHLTTFLPDEQIPANVDDLPRHDFAEILLAPTCLHAISLNASNSVCQRLIVAHGAPQEEQLVALFEQLSASGTGMSPEDLLIKQMQGMST